MWIITTCLTSCTRTSTDLSTISGRPAEWLRSFGTIRSAAWTLEVLQARYPRPAALRTAPPVSDGTTRSAAQGCGVLTQEAQEATCRRRPALSPDSPALRGCSRIPRVLCRRLLCLPALGRRPRSDDWAALLLGTFGGPPGGSTKTPAGPGPAPLRTGSPGRTGFRTEGRRPTRVIA